MGTRPEPSCASASITRPELPAFPSSLADTTVELVRVAETNIRGAPDGGVHEAKYMRRGTTGVGA